MSNNIIFRYTYAAKENEEAIAIREKYLPYTERKEEKRHEQRLRRIKGA